MRILVTSIVDLTRVTHNRIHVFVDYLSRTHDVTVLCLNAWWLEERRSKSGRADYHGDMFFQEMFERIRVLHLSQGRVPPVFQEVTALGTLRSLLDRIHYVDFDVHVNYCNLIAGYAVARRAKNRGIPTVFDIADDLPYSFRRSSRVPRLLGPLAGLVARTMLKANVRAASSVTFVTQALKDAYRLPDDKAVLIPNGVHEEFMAIAARGTLRQDLGLEQSFVLGFVGALLDWVDFVPAFTALKRMVGGSPEVKMLVVGGGPRLQESIELAAGYGISDRVIFTDQVPLSKIPDYISCMDVCLICRRISRDSDHSLPLKLFEYMACQKPVISVPLTGVRQAVGDLVLYARDSVELMDTVAELRRNAPLRHRMGVNGRRLVQEQYSWTHICRRFEEVLFETISESSLRSRP